MPRTRAFLPLLLAALAVLVGAFWLAPDASSLTPAEVQGVYTVKMSGDAWFRRDLDGSGPQAVQRVEQKLKGTLFLVLGVANDQKNDGLVTVEIRLSERHEGSALDRLTGSPDFVGTGLLVDGRLAVIDVGAPEFVSALNLRFDKRGKRVWGGWIVSFPAKTADATFMGGANVVLKGKRVRVRPGKPAPDLPPLDAGAAASDAVRR